MWPNHTHEEMPPFEPTSCQVGSWKWRTSLLEPQQHTHSKHSMARHTQHGTADARTTKQRKHETQKTDAMRQRRQQQRDDGYGKSEEVVKEEKKDRKGEGSQGREKKKEQEGGTRTFKHVCFVC